MKKITLHREEEFRLFDSVMEDFRKYRHKLYTFTSVVIIAALIVLLLLPNEYTATTRIMPENGSQNSKLASMASSIVPMELLSSAISSGGMSGGAQLKGLFTSNEVIDNLLEHKYTNLNNLPDGNLYQLLNIENKQYARDELLSRVTLKEEMKSGIMSISAVSNDPILSSQIANECVVQLEKFKRKLNVNAAREDRRFYSEQLKKANINLKKIEEAQIQFLLKNRNYVSSTNPVLRQKVTEFKQQVFFNTKLVMGMKQLLITVDTEISNDIPSIKILETAEIPLLKSGPSKKKYLVITLLGSFLFAFGLIVLKNAYRWYCPNKTKEELSSSINIIRNDINSAVNRLNLNKKENFLK